MCLLALFFRVIDGAPVLAGANREEFYQRGGSPPQVLTLGTAGAVRAVAGIDPVAGGTWFGVNEQRVLVAVTNRRKSQPPPQPRSRGLLTRELLSYPTAAAALARAQQALAQGPYDGCNFLCADPGYAGVIHAGDWLRVRPLPPGLHILTNRDINDASDRRLAHALNWLSQQHYRGAEHCMQALRELCAQHEPGQPAICFQHGDRGTVSSSIVALGNTLESSTYLHAQGPPDRTPYADYSSLLHQLERGE